MSANNDGNVNGLDRLSWITEVKQITFGDANLDGAFNSADLVQVFKVGEYEDAMSGNADRDVDSSVGNAIALAHVNLTHLWFAVAKRSVSWAADVLNCPSSGARPVVLVDDWLCQASGRRARDGGCPLHVYVGWLGAAIEFVFAGDRRSTKKPAASC
jgi:hypothetical protein